MHTITYFRYEIPSRPFSRTIIPDIMERVKTNVQTVFNEEGHVAITTDIWTSMNIDSFMRLTALFVETNLRELKTVVLCTKKLVSNYTFINLSEVINQEMVDWKILNKVFAIVTDGGANIKLTVKFWIFLIFHARLTG